MNLIASWFTSSALERDKYGFAATLFTDDFLDLSTLSEKVFSGTFKMSIKCALPVYFLVLKEEENCLQRLVASATMIKCNFAGTKTYL